MAFYDAGETRTIIHEGYQKTTTVVLFRKPDDFITVTILLGDAGTVAGKILVRDLTELLAS